MSLTYILNKTTLEVRKVDDVGIYSTADWIIDPNQEIIFGVLPKYWKVDGDSVVEMSTAEKDAAFLDEEKSTKLGTIDSRTRELISAGFTYSEDTFSLSLAAQNKLLNLYIDKTGDIYPLVINNIDDSDTVSLADETAFDAFYLAARTAIKTHVDGGTTLKSQVRAASTIAEVQAVTDER